MSAKTGIEWTDATWNPVVGCERVSPGCAHCYAKALHDQRHTAHLAGKQVAPQYAEPFEVVQLMPERLTYPLSWREPRRVFVNSVSDLFHESVPDEYIAKVFAVMALADRHTFQVLTKRPTRMRQLLNDPDFAVEMVKRIRDGQQSPDVAWLRWPLPNVWLGVSVENQRWANERIPLLLDTPSAKRFLSCEPLLGPVYIAEYLPNPLWDNLPSWQSPVIDWIIAGAESGRGARPMERAWVESLRDQCVESGKTKFMFKQDAMPNGRKISLPVLDGRQWAEMPELSHRG
jgi:protein gp37